MNEHDQREEIVHAACEMDRQARQLWDQGDQSGAIKLLDEALATSPEASIAFRLAQYHEQLGEHADALLAAGYAYARAPSRNEIAAYFAQLLANIGQRRRAIEIANEILNRTPHDGPAKRLLQTMEATP